MPTSRLLSQELRRQGDDLAAIVRRLDRIEDKLDRMRGGLDRTGGTLDKLIEDLPRLLKASIRQVFREERT